MAQVTPDVACFLRFLGGGGAERIILNLTRGFVKRGLKVDLVLTSTGGPHLWQVPSEVRIVDLKTPRLLASLPSLVRYLNQEQPKSLLSTLHYNNEFALLAKRFSKSSTRVVVREANTLSLDAKPKDGLKKRLIPLFVRQLYPWADNVVAVSKGVAEDLANVTDLPLKRIQTIYNPTITPDLLLKAQERVEHPWFQPGQPPVILGVGRLQAQKDFPTLIRAFAQVRQVREAKLVILGWGPDRPQLEALISELGLVDDVDLPDHVKNPYAYMARSSVFVLSSAWEGLPNALIEAMAVGVPVVSTDCKSGPNEILDNGKYGFLVPVGDNGAIAQGILSILSGNSQPVDPSWLEQFTLETVTQQYLEALGIL
ncbi:MAG: glycosyltransferase [Nostocaceae cyanobacterium]|nr:glycosyltransferase [Nostocaceae cyanobacterium]